MSERAESVVAIIPAFNVERQVGDVVRRLRAALPDARVIVVDDGSQDYSADVAREAGAEVVRHLTNRGKGAALRTGIAAALALNPAVVLTLDADGQHPPEYAPQLLEASRTSDVVIGARARRGSPMPFARRITNGMSSAVVSMLAGTRISDSQSGFRAIRADVLRAIDARGDRYDLETDFLVRAARAGCRIAEVSVPTVYAGAASHFRGVRDTALLVRAMFRLRFASAR